MEIIIYLLLLFLSVVGLCDIIHCVRLSLLDIKGEANKIICCKLNGKFADLQLRFVIEQYNWFGRKYADKVIAISYLDDERLIDRCKYIADRHNIQFINHTELHNLINSEM